MNLTAPTTLRSAKSTAAVILLVLVLLAGGLCFSLWPFHRLLTLYAAILATPILALGAWRLSILWRSGFVRLPRHQGRSIWAYGALAFLSLVVLLYAFEGWRGRRSLAALEKELANRGESLDFQTVVPDPIPDADNLGALPLLRALVDCESRRSPFHASWVTWRDEATFQRLKKLSLPARPDGRNPAWHSEAAPWLSEFTDLEAWRQALATNEHYGPPSPISNPAHGLLQALAVLNPELTELHRGSQRPGFRWDLPYEDGWLAIMGAHRRDTILDTFVRALCLQTLAKLELEQAEDAWNDWTLAWRLVQSTKQEPTFGIQLRRLSRMLEVLQPVWEGLARQRWTESQLTAIERLLNREDLAGDWRHAIRSDAYYYIDMARHFESSLTLGSLYRHRQSLQEDAAWVFYGLAWATYPRGWFSLNQVLFYRWFEAATTHTEPFARAPFATETQSWRNPIDPLVFTFITPRLRENLHQIASFESVALLLHQARLACALERYRLAHADFPRDTQALIPQYLDRLPSASGTSQALLVYERHPDGSFTLSPAPGIAPSTTGHITRMVAQTWRYPETP